MRIPVILLALMVTIFESVMKLSGICVALTVPDKLPILGLSAMLLQFTLPASSAKRALGTTIKSISAFNRSSSCSTAFFAVNPAGISIRIPTFKF